MTVYRSKQTLLKGSSYSEVVASARKEYNTIRKLTKRQPYVRSKYFRGDKIFVTVFWDHLMQKHPKERRKRLKFYNAAIDLMRNTTLAPDTIFSEADKHTLLHRFYGVSAEGLEFCVQVKEDKRTGRKDFMSVFAKKTTTKKISCSVA
ncbi:hypothetical protein IPM09_03295 [Candidatus Saccharibacteria bacterium]|nr:MAG: hypothetical protein IPM09_03295 [Candidatus Saccharibacteria bacterium]